MSWNCGAMSQAVIVGPGEAVIRYQLHVLGLMLLIHPKEGASSWRRRN